VKWDEQASSETSNFKDCDPKYRGKLSPNILPGSPLILLILLLFIILFCPPNAPDGRNAQEFWFLDD
jgi:hypothetical protein